MGLLRFTLALCVLFTHFPDVSIFGIQFGDGTLAVQCFYMISGFYMALVLHEKYTGPRSYRLFLEQRYLRLYPTYLSLFLLTLAVEYWVRSPRHLHWGLDYWTMYGSRLASSAWLVLGLSNLSILGLDPSCLFTGFDPQTGHLYWTSTLKIPIPGLYFCIIPPAWTIDMEACFYLAAPFLVRRSAAFQASIVLLTFALRIFFAHYLHLNQDSWSYRFYFFEIGIFLMGSLAYRFYRDHAPFLQRQIRLFPWVRWIVFFLWAFYSRLPLPADARYYLFAVGTFVLLPYLFLMTRDLVFDRLLGELSYPMYLGHWSILLLFGHLIGQLPSYLGGLVYVGLVVLLSWIIYRFIEHPMDDFRHRLFQRQKSRADLEAKPKLAPAES
jgi:peptidoglycan/LPS O-acetylase OafA/YrhL